jgi:hypothetical protein
MRSLTMSVLLLFAINANAAEVVRVSPWELHNSFWMSLHHTLIADAMRPKPRELGTLSVAEQAAWNEAVTAYRNTGGQGDMTFTRPMIITNDGLTQVADDATQPLIDAPLADALKRAAPVYRAHWWAADHKANQFFIAYAAAMLREAGEDLIRAHETVYRTAWPKRVLVYVTPYAGQAGAYTMIGRAGGVITTMSSRDSGYQGLRALEMLLHESAHAVVAPTTGTLGAAITTAQKQQGLDAPRDLWHAILFTTSGELTRRLLAERGATQYVPMSENVFTKYREPIQKHWLPYLNGQGTLEDAVAKVLSAIPR